MRHPRTLTALLITFTLIEGRAHAQLTGDQAIAAAGAARSNLPPDTFGGEATFGKLAEDYFITLALRLNFDREMFGFGLQVPVRFRIIDNDPQQSMSPEGDDFGGIIRREDWDEPSDFLKVIRYVYVGQADKKGPFYVRVGELSGLTVGHGTIMYRYFNGLDPDVWHTGVNAAVNIGAFGVEAVTGDIANPYILGGRFTVRPLELALGEGLFWEKLVVGVSAFTDARAPLALETRTATKADGTSEVLVVADEEGRPKVATTEAMVILGTDVGIELFSNELFSVTPYVDLNWITNVDYGVGFHAGVLWGFRLPVAIDTLVVDVRTEYRRVTGDYIGPYFNTAYEIERLQTLSSGGGLPVPKQATLVSYGARNGVFFDLLAGFPQFVFIGGEFVDYDGGIADGQLRLSLEVPALEFVKFSAFYYRINISGSDDFFKLDDRSAIVASASVPLYYVFTLNLKWWRVWQAQQVDGSTTYEAVDDWSVGVGFSLEL
jgi:hypothetical protein